MRFGSIDLGQFSFLLNVCSWPISAVRYIIAGCRGVKNYGGSRRAARAPKRRSEFDEAYSKLGFRRLKASVRRPVFSWANSLERILCQCSPGRHRLSQLVVHFERLRTQLSLVPCKPDSLQSEMPSPAEWVRRAVANRHIADGEFGSSFGLMACLSQRTSMNGGKIALI